MQTAAIDSSSPRNPAPAPAPECVTLHQIAGFLKVSPRTGWQMKADRKLPRPIRIGKATSRWLLSEIEAWMLAGCPDQETWDAMRKGALAQ